MFGGLNERISLISSGSSRTKILRVLRLSGTVAALSFVLLGLSCTKKPGLNGGSSVISLQLPAKDGSSKAFGKGGVSAFAAIPANRKACFGVNVLADDIVGLPENSCNPKVGLVAGFIESGGTISLEVPRGERRTFDLYLYLAPEGDLSPCPQMPLRFSTAQLKNLYYIGTSGPVSLTKLVEEINIVASFPGLAQTFAAVNSYPASCTSFPEIQPGFSVIPDRRVVTGGNITLSGRVGAANGKVLSGGGIKLIAE